MIRFAICDDFAEDRDFIRKVLTAYFHKRNERIEVTEYEEGTVLLDDYADADGACFDVIFLDIFMKKSHGMRVAEQLRHYDKQAVSYTHLDVYKRQASSLWMKRPAPWTPRRSMKSSTPSRTEALPALS